MSAMTALLTKDARVIARDPMMALLVVYPLLIAALTRLIPNWVTVEHLDVYLAPTAPTVAPSMVGLILGFALIEERENRTWLLLRVVPLSETALVGYLVGASGVFSCLTALISSYVYGLGVSHWPLFIASVVVASLTAPLMAFVLGAIASNKIEGLVVAKILGFIPVTAALVFVLPPVWQSLLFWNPYYWIYLGLLAAFVGPEADAGLAVQWPPFSEWSYVIVPFVLCAAAVLPLARAYRRRAA